MELSSQPDLRREPVIVVDKLTARFGDQVIFADVSFEVYRGEIFVILGG